MTTNFHPQKIKNKSKCSRLYSIKRENTLTVTKAAGMRPIMVARKKI